MPELSRLCVSPSSTMLEVMARINETGYGIALIVDAGGRLLDTVTDGDLRRAILAGTDLSRAISSLQPRRSGPPVTAPQNSSKAELVHLMKARSIRHVPRLDAAGKVAAIAVLDELVEDARPEPTAVVMAGGFGKRLLPLTEETPKPMLPMGKRPLVEHTIEALRAAGIQRVCMTTHYKKDVLADHFGDGGQFGLHIDYVEEEVPLGTAGALGLLRDLNEVLLVVNGDIVTELNYRSLLSFHREHNAEMTVGVRQYEFHVPYGVVSTNGAEITALTEKPTQRMFVNAGIYLLEPHVCSLVPTGRAFDMTDLIEKMMHEKRRVLAFPISEYWVDIGEHDAYQKAKEHFEATQGGSR